MGYDWTMKLAKTEQKKTNKEWTIKRLWLNINIGHITKGVENMFIKGDRCNNEFLNCGNLVTSTPYLGSQFESFQILKTEWPGSLL